MAQTLTVAVVESWESAELDEAAVGCTSLVAGWEALGWELLARAGVEPDCADPAEAEASVVGVAADVVAVVGAALAVPSLVGAATDVAAVVGAVVAAASVAGAALAVPSAAGAALAAASVVESSVVDSSSASVSSGRSTFSSGSTTLGAVEFSARADAVTDDEAAGDETAAEGASVAGSDDAGLDDAEVAAADGVAVAPRGLTSWVSASPCSRILGPWLSTRRVPWPSWLPGSGAQPAISPAEAMAATLILSVCADPISPTSFRQANRVRLPEMYVKKVFSDHSERDPPGFRECNTPGAGC
ncbi:hypothetical protein [Acidipropionibacterium thoenii]|uniref:hypothetical protein n=1 Tax=Acidipropionibacterium thoenii TaxID=1751 RepID=UPI000415BA78|nr:hypothetical protein [Acidipropionibacterium thoenii]